MIGGPLDQGVDLGAAARDAPHQPAGVVPDGRFGPFLLHRPAEDRFEVRIVELELEQDLEGALPGGPAFSHAVTASRPSSG